MIALLQTSTSRRLFQLVLVGIAFTALGTGAWAFISGAAGLPGPNSATSTVDQEIRFLAVFWTAFGGAVLYVRHRMTPELVRVIAAAVFLGGVGRGISLLAVGPPHPMFIVLMILELVGPLCLVFWHSRLNAS